MRAKRFICSTLIFCLLLSGCASRNASFPASTEIETNESDGNSALNSFLKIALMFGVSLTLAALIGGSGDTDKHGRHRGGHHR